MLQALGNLQAFPHDGSNLRWRELLGDAELSLDKATDVVLGLLALEATLSIALALVTPRPSEVKESNEVKAYVNAYAWAQVAAFSALLTSALALAIALTQWFAEDSNSRPVMAAILTCLGLLAVVLSLAVTSYTGQETADNIYYRRSIEALDRGLRRRFQVLHSMPAVKVRGGLLRFSASSGVTVAVLVVVAQWIWGAPETAWPWPWRFLGLTAFVAGLAAVMVGLTKSLWQAQLGTSVTDRLIMSFFRGFFWLSMTSALFVMAYQSTTEIRWLVVGSIWIGGLGMPALALTVARRLGRGPARFAVRAHGVWAQVRRADLKRRLERQP
ncbi:hypothetical protein [Geodermatophilus telluris]|nr:hypothetical protein [Geodermatophilus telluris]